jgi:uncharacterized membrane protein
VQTRNRSDFALGILFVVALPSQVHASDFTEVAEVFVSLNGLALLIAAPIAAAHRGAARVLTSVALVPSLLGLIGAANLAADQNGYGYFFFGCVSIFVFLAARGLRKTSAFRSRPRY